MAKSKATGSKARQKKRPAGKRLGLKVGAGEAVGPGEILVRQRGSNFHAGRNVKQGRDFTLYSLAEGVVKFGNLRGGRKSLSVIPSDN
ncbi:MAG: 50S ribosomal protein L27 [Patescibacteria group bacterium]